MTGPRRIFDYAYDLTTGVLNSMSSAQVSRFGYTLLAVRIAGASCPDAEAYWCYGYDTVPGPSHIARVLRRTAPFMAIDRFALVPRASSPKTSVQRWAFS